MYRVHVRVGDCGCIREVAGTRADALEVAYGLMSALATSADTSTPLRVTAVVTHYSSEDNNEEN